MARIGLAFGCPPMEPRKGVPKLKMPPSAAAIQ